MSSVKLIEEFDDVINKYDPAKNRTKAVLSRYEKAKVIGMRIEQLARNAPPCIDVKQYSNLHSVTDIAYKELEERKLPFLIARTLPNGTKEYWKLEDLVVV